MYLIVINFHNTYFKVNKCIKKKQDFILNGERAYHQNTQIYQWASAVKHILACFFSARVTVPHPLNKRIAELGI